MKLVMLFVAVSFAAPAAAQSGAVSSSQPVASTTLAPVEAEAEKLICKKQVVIGSLIAKKRVCATARNWERNEALAKEHLEILTAPGAFAPSG